MKRTVAFDFDGTYTRHDSLPLMLKHAFGWERYLAGLLMCLPWIILFKLGILKGGEAKQRLLSHFFKGMPYSRFLQLCENFAPTHPNLVRHQARVAMDEALEAGDRVLVVTASVREWVEPFFRGQDVTVLATGTETAKSALAGGSRAGSYNMVTLEVTPREAEMLVFAEQIKGRLSIALRNPTDVHYESELPRVNFEKIEQEIESLNTYRQRTLLRKRE